jgi:cysteine synthase A
MLEDFLNGLYDDIHTIVIDSSGNTAHAVARLAPAFGFKTIKVVMSTDVPNSKKDIFTAFPFSADFSVEIIQVGGKVSRRAQEEASRPGHYHLDQYSHLGNMRAHELYTGPEIVRALGGSARIGVVAAAMGSGGTAAGIGRFFEREHPETIILGVRPLPGEQVPGARDSRRMKEVVTLPWEEVVDEVREVSRKESFIRMRRLWSAVEPQPGPTSGLAWGGLEHLLESYSPDMLASLRGKVACFVCPDDGRFYPERTTGELDPDQGAA